jgi:type IV secretory pathway TrbD component
VSHLPGWTARVRKKFEKTRPFGANPRGLILAKGLMAVNIFALYLDAVENGESDFWKFVMHKT